MTHSRLHEFCLLAGAVLFLGLSCEQEQPQEVCQKSQKVVFSASFDNSSSRTTLSGNKVLWESGDRISIFDGDTNIGATTQDSGASATFEAEIAAEGPWYALYPYNADAAIVGGQINATVSAEQDAVAGSFAKRQNIALAMSEGANLVFKNVLSYVKLRVGRDDVIQITFKGNDSEYIAGNILIDYNSGSPVYSVVSGVTSVSLIPLGGCFAVGGSYYIALLPQTLSNGFSLEYSLADGTSFSACVSKSLELKRSTIVSFGDPEDKVEFLEVIDFADPDVEADVVEHLKSKGYTIADDGKLQKAVAATVTYSDMASLSWSDASAIDSFDELQYFSGLKKGAVYSLPAIFTNCSNLTSVILPSNIQQIESAAFSGCSSLTTVTIPETLEIIANNAFYACSSLARVSTASNPEAYLKLPSSMKTIGQYAFRSCTSLTVNSDSFSESSLETIGKRAFTAVSHAQNIILPASLTSISARAFESCTLINLTIEATTPPSIPLDGSYTDIFSNGSIPNISVPLASLDAYRSHADWEQYYSYLGAANGFVVPSGVQVKGELIDVRAVKSGEYAFPQNEDYQFGADIVGHVGLIQCADSHLERRGVTSVRCSSGSPMIACTASAVSGWVASGKSFSLAGHTWYIHYYSAYVQGEWLDVPFSDSWGFCPLVLGDGITVEGTQEFGTVISEIGKLRGGAVNNVCITLLPDGTYLAACTNVKEQSGLVMFRSTDKGTTWKKYGNFNSEVNLIVNYTNLFVLDDTVYLMGLAKDGEGNSVGLRISKSTDNGLNWTVPDSATSGLLLEGRYNTGQVPCVVAKGRIWRACENENNKPFMLSAPVNSDLLKASNWTLTNTVATTAYYIGSVRITSMGEGNAVVGPDGNVVNVVRNNCNTSSAYATILHTSGTTGLSYNSSTDWVNMPGGGKKFTIRYDEVSGLYWSLTNPHFDEEVTNIGIYSEGMSPGLKRNRLVLISSPDLRNWTEERTILYDSDPFFHGFQYADWVIDGDDLAVVVRAAYPEKRGLPKRQHDANKFIFVKVPSFRVPGMPAGNEGFSGNNFIF